MYQIWRIYLDFWGHDCKKWVWPTFGCKLGQSDPIVMQLKLGMSSHPLNVYKEFQIDISKPVEEKSWKRGRTDGQTDRRTDGHCNGIIRPLFKRAYKNVWTDFRDRPIMTKLARIHTPPIHKNLKNQITFRTLSIMLLTIFLSNNTSHNICYVRNSIIQMVVENQCFVFVFAHARSNIGHTLGMCNSRSINSS